ncbi:DNA (cytosine-5)-methyltransferase 3A-like [Macrosteles quadrilineatus]|uniref:DNA (cytosine-5)-methyltransferase 3A-like n=1 Tax=Macrosteles quadrilineatus TaxID=74068 RepID=UPI0023E24E50|nr:DNA (cytosine-5)-methyltransferase 3A-like [Macrosteles quadrilineatus]
MIKKKKKNHQRYANTSSRVEASTSKGSTTSRVEASTSKGSKASYATDTPLGDQSFPLGSVVWCTFGKDKKTRYIGMIVGTFPALHLKTKNERNVYWFGEKTVSTMPIRCIRPFNDVSVFGERKTTKIHHGGLEEAIKTIVGQYGVNPPMESPKDKRYSVEEFFVWVMETPFKKSNYNIPESISKIVEATNDYYVEIDPEDGPSDDNLKQETKFPVPMEARDVKKLCMGCYEVPQPDKASAHPLVKGLLCHNCKSQRLVQVQLFVCKKYKLVICRLCMEFWMPKAYKRCISNKFRWTCIFCEDSQQLVCALPRDEADLMCPDVEDVPVVSESEKWPPRKPVSLQTATSPPALRVLSLFDGISAGKLALTNLGLKVEKYFASEIDRDAITVSKAFHGEEIEQIGDVMNISSQTLANYLPIHLIIGGSPCNDLSRVNPARKGLSDMNGSGTLFFEYYRIVKLVESLQGSETFFFLYENVSSMKEEHADTISRFFESSPVLVDAKHFSAMRRPRLFWGNIPKMTNLSAQVLSQTQDGASQSVQENLTPHLGRQAMVKTLKTITTNKNSLNKSNGSPQVTEEGEPTTLTIIEIEQVFGFPKHYTDVGIGQTARRRLVGKSWCVPVIENLLRPLTEL